MKNENSLWIKIILISIGITFLSILGYFLRMLPINVAIFFLGITEIVSGINQLKGSKNSMSISKMIFSYITIVIGSALLIITFMV